MMKRVPIALLIATIVLAAAASAVSASEQTPAGSFLKYRATSVEQLAGQVTKEPAVRLRYAQHFGVSPDEVGTYFTENLKLVTLKKPLRVTTWYVGKSGRIYKKTKLFPKVTMVFASKDDKPVLAWSCGNPLRASLPLELKKQPTTSSVSATATAAAEPVETMVLPSVEAIAATAVTAPPAPAAIAVTPVAALPPIGNYAVPPIAVPPPLADRFGLGWLLPLFFFHDEPPPPPPPPVPEPASLVALAMGSAMMPLAMRTIRPRGRR